MKFNKENLCKFLTITGFHNFFYFYFILSTFHTPLFPNLSDLTITGVTPNGKHIVLNISSNTTNESLNLSITADNSLVYSLTNGSLHLSDLNNSFSGFSNNTTQEEYPFDADESPIGSLHNSPNNYFSSLNDSIITIPHGGKKSRKLKKRNKNKKKRKTKKNKTKCIY